MKINKAYLIALLSFSIFALANGEETWINGTGWYHTSFTVDEILATDTYVFVTVTPGVNGYTRRLFIDLSAIGGKSQLAALLTARTNSVPFKIGWRGGFSAESYGTTSSDKVVGIDILK